VWFDILKMPVVEELEVDDRFDQFLGSPQSFQQQFSTHPYQWQSQDENARAKFGLDASKDYPIWYIDVFEISHDERGQGLSRIYLQELIREIRKIEDNLNIEDVKRKNPNLAFYTTPPYEIRGMAVDSAKGFWDKIHEEGITEGYLGDAE
jgi:hypothetical protein